MEQIKCVFKFIARYFKGFIIIATPLALLPLVIVTGTSEAKAAYIILLMTIYWVAEVMPMGITALIPVILVPMFKIMPSKDICPAYFKDSNMLFLGGLMLATSIEYWQLHKRIALRVMMISGVQPRWLLMGFMLPTWVLSMWISNTATTSMMLPISDAVLRELKRHYEKETDEQEVLGVDNPEYKLENSRQHSLSNQGSYSRDVSNLDVSDVVLNNVSHFKELSMPKIEEGVVMDASETAFHPTPDLSHGTTLPPRKLSRSISRADQMQQDFAMMKMNLNKKPMNKEEEISLKEYIKSNKNPEFSNICKMYLIGIAFGSSFGGLCTITGTAPNVIINGMVQEFFGADTSLNYSNWIFFATPVSIICTIFGWAWLQVLFLGPRALVRRRQLNLSAEQEEKINDGICDEYNNLGTIKFAEVMVIIGFVITVCLWIGREPGAPGWITAFRDSEVRVNGTVVKKSQTFMSDAQPAILMTILLFLCPSKLPCIGQADAPLEEEAVVEGKHGTKKKTVMLKSATILNWEMVHKGVPWQLFLLLGGGFALAETSKTSGLSDWIGSQLAVFESIPLVGLLFIIAFSTALITEVTSNGTAATLLLPIYASLAPKIGAHPFYLMLVCTLSCSFAYNLPIATPTNVLIYSSGYLRMIDLIKSGMVLFVFANCLSVLATMTYGAAIFDLHTLPTWANRNTTFKL